MIQINTNERFFVYHKDYAKTLGVTATMVLSVVLDLTELSHKNLDRFYDSKGVFCLIKESALASMFNVSNKTIRNAMNKLEKSNLATYYYGEDEYKIYPHVKYNSKGYYIPKRYLQTQLKPIDLLIIGFIYSNMRRNKVAFHREYIQKSIGITQPTCTTHINQLIKLGYIHEHKSYSQNKHLFELYAPGKEKEHKKCMTKKTAYKQKPATKRKPTNDSSSQLTDAAATTHIESDKWGVHPFVPRLVKSKALVHAFNRFKTTDDEQQLLACALIRLKENMNGINVHDLKQYNTILQFLISTYNHFEQKLQLTFETQKDRQLFRSYVIRILSGTHLTRTLTIHNPYSYAMAIVRNAISEYKDFSKEQQQALECFKDDIFANPLNRTAGLYHEGIF